MLIWGENLQGVKIYGPGTLDGSALTRSDTVPRGTGDRGISLKLCKDVEIRNLNIEQGGHFAILATGCEDMLSLFHSYVFEMDAVDYTAVVRCYAYAGFTGTPYPNVLEPVVVERTDRS